ncbi:MAG: 30S ribosomal protein S20 [Minisyncoccia bacterium]
MAITSSAKKANRASLKKRVFNIRTKRGFEDEIRDIKILVKEGKIKEAEKALPVAYKAIDKAMKRDYIKKNTAARYKSRLTLFVNKGKK